MILLRLNTESDSFSAEMAKLADALVSGTSAFTGLGVQIPLSAQIQICPTMMSNHCL